MPPLKPKKSTLSKAEELQHLVQAKQGCQKSTQIILKKYKNLCHKLAAKYLFMTSLQTIEDLIQEANVGLLRAIRTYDTERKTVFLTWAYYHVRGAVTKAVRPEEKKPKYPHSIEDCPRAYNIEDPKQIPRIQDSWPLQLLAKICNGSHTREFKLAFDRYGLGTEGQLTIKQCRSKYNMPAPRITKKMKEIHNKMEIALKESGYSDSIY